MAKGKHSTALFEVIHSGKRPERIAQSLRTPKWWFKGKQTPAAPASAGEAAMPAPEPMYAPPEPAEPIAPAPTVAAPPSPPATAPRSMDPNRTGGRSSAVHFDFDRERKEIRLRLRYTTALVSGFGVCVLIGLSYVAGRHLGRGPQAALASEQPDIRQLMQQPPHPAVADIGHARSSRSQQSAGVIEPARRASGFAHQPVASRPPVHQSASLVPRGIEDRLPRTIGLNYVIVQTYPPEERQAAEAARDYLTSHGVPCTLETAAGFTRDPRWICLMGTAGFVHISSREYKAYIQAILAVGETFKTSHFNRWSPGAYKYKG